MRTLLQTFVIIASCYSFVKSSTSIVPSESVPILTSKPHLKSECLLSLTDQTVKDKIKIFNAQSKKQIFLHFKLPGIEHLKTNGTIYRPLDIVCTNGSHSKEMLLLHPQFEQFSVGVLKFGVEHVDVHLVGLPSSCFSEMTEEDLQNRLFSLAFMELGLLEADNEKTRVCNQHMYGDGGYADIYYKCCFPDTSGNYICEKNTPNEWFTVLTIAVFMIYLLVAVCSPLLIPKIWFQESKYEKYVIKRSEPFVIKTNSNDLETANKYMKPKWTSSTDNSSSQQNRFVTFKSVTINTPTLKPVTTDRLPLGLLNNLLKAVLKPKTGKQKESDPECSTACNSDSNPFHQCVKLLIHFAVLLCLLIPFLVRLILFYVFEQDDRTNREQFAANQNLSYPHGIKWNVTYSLQPDHPFLIVCYVTVIFIPFIRQFIKIVTSTFDDIECFKTVAVCNTAYSIVTYIPIVKLCLTLFCGLFKLTWHQTYKISCKRALIMPIFTSLLIFNTLMVIPIFSYLVFCSEVMIFVIQLLLYVFIGLILNTTHVLTYISFGIWVIFYGGVFVKSIRSKYENFCRKVIEHFSSISNEKSENENEISIIENENDENITQSYEQTNDDDRTNQPNCAIPLNSTAKEMRLGLKYGKPILSTEMPFLFYQNGKPFITEDFFMTLCNLHCVGAPGSIWENNKNAIVNYIQVVLFLALVTIVVLAFGEASGITGTYQAVVALGGGLIPLLLKKFSSSDGESIDFGKAFSFNELTNSDLDCRTVWEISHLSAPKETLNDKYHAVLKIDMTEKHSGYIYGGVCPISECCNDYCKVPLDIAT